jgi:hypothetical protein
MEGADSNHCTIFVACMQPEGGKVRRRPTSVQFIVQRGRNGVGIIKMFRSAKIGEVLRISEYPDIITSAIAHYMRI